MPQDQQDGSDWCNAHGRYNRNRRVAVAAEMQRMIRQRPVERIRCDVRRGSSIRFAGCRWHVRQRRHWPIDAAVPPNSAVFPCPFQRFFRLQNTVRLYRLCGPERDSDETMTPQRHPATDSVRVAGAEPRDAVLEPAAVLDPPDAFFRDFVELAESLAENVHSPGWNLGLAV